MSEDRLTLLWLFVLWLFVNFCLILGRQQETAEHLSYILSNLDESAEPCEDFYRYACGGWANQNNSTEYLDVPAYMDHLVNSRLRELLLSHKGDNDLYEKVNACYEACVNLNAPALNGYLRILQDELGIKWPIFRDDWSRPWINSTKFDWLQVIAHLRRYGLNGVFIMQNVNVLPANGSHYLLDVRQGWQPKSLELKYEQVNKILMDFGLEKDEGNKLAEDLVQLEFEISNLRDSEAAAEQRNSTESGHEDYSSMTIEALIKTIPQLDWHKYFERVLGRSVNESKEMVQLYGVQNNYFANLTKTLGKTPNETIAYYIMFKLMFYLNADLPKAQDKSLACIKHLRAYMPLAINYFYDKHFYAIRRNSTDEILNIIFRVLKETFRAMVHENHLGLSEEEQNLVLGELKTMRIKIGNLPQRVSEEFVRNYYKDIAIDTQNFYKNHLELLKLRNQREQMKLQNSPTSDALKFYEYDAEFSTSSSPVKVFDNAVLVPFGYLQLPLFDAEWHELFQYSLFGFILAHEIMHAYDFFHLVYDQHSNFNSIGLGIADHLCQFINCSASDATSTILSENIADISGLRLAFRAYFDSVERSVEFLSRADPLNTPSNLTKQQLFFINSVQFLCANMPQILKMDMDLSELEHEMHDVRVRRNWAQFDEFAYAFNCSNNSSMHPTDKTRLW